jgi:hypothetical protein
VCFSVARRLAASALISRGTFIWVKIGTAGQGSLPGRSFCRVRTGAG